MTYDDDLDFVCTCDGFDISQECPVHQDPRIASAEYDKDHREGPGWRE